MNPVRPPLDPDQKLKVRQKTESTPAPKGDPPTFAEISGEPSPKERRFNWGKELSKFMNLTVTVDYLIGSQFFTIDGRLRGVDVNSMHCIVDTETEAVFIRYPLRIFRRRRTVDAREADVQE